MAELFNNKGVMRKISLNNATLISWLKPGDYNLRVFIDRNNNGYWDPGSPTEKTMSETIKIYPDKITIRPNWEIDLIITPPN